MKKYLKEFGQRVEGIIQLNELPTTEVDDAVRNRKFNFKTCPRVNKKKREDDVKILQDEIDKREKQKQEKLEQERKARAEAAGMPYEK
uniref:Uncharacterized protein n=1 Tax=Panagrolaimus sp. JU765 TaxID=591449 RepID=A0AC34Q4Z1_9BILA